MVEETDARIAAGTQQTSDRVRPLAFVVVIGKPLDPARATVDGSLRLSAASADPSLPLEHRAVRRRG